MTEKEQTPEPDVHEQISQLFDTDQADRHALPAQQPSQEKLRSLRESDEQRRAQAKQIYSQYKEGGVTLSGDDLYKLAMIFHHGETPENFRTAFELAQRAEQKGSTSAPLLVAQVEDRLLLAETGKQKWGTQYDIADDGTATLLPMVSDEQSGITDEMRRERGVLERRQQIEQRHNK